MPGSERGKKRQQLAAVREELEDLMDYLDLVEARAKDGGKARLSQQTVKRRDKVEFSAQRESDPFCKLTQPCGFSSKQRQNALFTKPA